MYFKYGANTTGKKTMTGIKITSSGGTVRYGGLLVLYKESAKNGLMYVSQLDC